MKLYVIAGSPNSRKALAVVNHLGLEVDIEYLDLFEGDHKHPEYTALNPNGMVPTLVDGGLKLWESNAIMQYLADTSENDVLFPRDLVQRADVTRWQMWELANFNQAFGTLAFETVAKPNFMSQEGNEAVASWAKDNLNRYASILNQHLEDRDYLVGDNMTLADYSMIHVEFFKEMVPFDWSTFIHLNEYFERIRQSTHWVATAPASADLIGRKPEA